MAKKVAITLQKHLIALFLVISLISLPAITIATSLSWVQTSGSGGFSILYATAEHGNHIYSVGFDNSLGGLNLQSRIEKRNKSNGVLSPSFGTAGVITSNPSTGPDGTTAIAIYNNSIYTAGFDSSPSSGLGNDQWRIEKRNITNGSLVSSFGTAGVVTSNPSLSYDEATDIVVDSTGLYVIGTDSSLGNGQWRIEKRNLSNGNLISSFGTAGVVTSNPSSDDDTVGSAVIANNSLYIGGLDYSNGGNNSQWRVEKRRLSNGSLVGSFGTGGVVQSNPSNGLNSLGSLTVDSSGVFLAGSQRVAGTDDSSWRIEKRNLTNGNLISSFGTGGAITSNPSNYLDGITSICAVSSGLYVYGSDFSTSTTNSVWRIEKRNLSNGNLVNTFGSSGVLLSNPTSGLDYTMGLLIDQSGFYAFGFTSVDGSAYNWRIEKYLDNTYLRTSLSLSARPKNLKRGKRTLLKGQLKDSNKKKLSSQIIRFYKKVLKANKKWAWKRINIQKRVRITIRKKVNGKIRTYKKWVLRARRYLTTDKNGKFAGYISPSNTAHYKAVFSGSFGYKPKSSKQIRVAVR
ncbi:MAG: hypothetical protein C4562_04560 [Actinobacteria bacterium]|nr:MAG: hypothetical protein C4562_04560 [Actinomycetota bacterium]